MGKVTLLLSDTRLLTVWMLRLTIWFYKSHTRTNTQAHPVTVASYWAIVACVMRHKLFIDAFLFCVMRFFSLTFSWIIDVKKSVCVRCCVSAFFSAARDLNAGQMAFLWYVQIGRWLRKCLFQSQRIQTFPHTIAFLKGGTIYLARDCSIVFAFPKSIISRE